jgi:hypothetical protein
MCVLLFVFLVEAYETRARRGAGGESGKLFFGQDIFVQYCTVPAILHAGVLVLYLV